MNGINHEQRGENQAAFRRLKPQLDRAYPAGQFLAIHEGAVVADAAGFDELDAKLHTLGHDTRVVLIVQAGVDYPERATILLQNVPA